MTIDTEKVLLQAITKVAKKFCSKKIIFNLDDLHHALIHDEMVSVRMSVLYRRLAKGTKMRTEIESLGLRIGREYVETCILPPILEVAKLIQHETGFTHQDLKGVLNQSTYAKNSPRLYGVNIVTLLKSYHDFKQELQVLGLVSTSVKVQNIYLFCAKELSNQKNEFTLYDLADKVSQYRGCCTNKTEVRKYLLIHPDLMRSTQRLGLI